MVAALACAAIAGADLTAQGALAGSPKIGKKVSGVVKKSFFVSGERRRSSASSSRTTCAAGMTAKVFPFVPRARLWLVLVDVYDVSGGGSHPLDCIAPDPSGNRSCRPDTIDKAGGVGYALLVELQDVDVRHWVSPGHDSRVLAADVADRVTGLDDVMEIRYMSPEHRENGVAGGTVRTLGDAVRVAYERVRGCLRILEGLRCRGVRCQAVPVVPRRPPRR
jgi:hypothetical protein